MRARKARFFLVQAAALVEAAVREPGFLVLVKEAAAKTAEAVVVQAGVVQAAWVTVE